VIGGDAARAEQLMREHVYYAGILLRDNYQRLVDERERDSPMDAPLARKG
jgi:GntR family transcriptional regulator of vanillate catabolism